MLKKTLTKEKFNSIRVNMSSNLTMFLTKYFNIESVESVSDPLRAGSAPILLAKLKMADRVIAQQVSDVKSTLLNSASQWLHSDISG